MEPVLEKVHSEGRCCMSFHPSSQYLCIGGSNGYIKQYSYGSDANKLSLSNPMDSSDQYHDDPINQIHYCSSGDYFAICCDDGEVVLFRHEGCTMSSLIAKYDCPISSISFLNEPHSFLFAISTDTGKIKLVNALDFTNRYFEFPIENCDGIRFIKFINYKPDPFRISREKYLAISQCNGNFSIWKILKLNIFNHELKNINEKFIKVKEFENIFPKIKGGDTNQRLEFDCTKNGNLMAIPGNKTIKMLATKSMTFMQCESDMSHIFNTNCCAFNHYLECIDSTNYILATSDINGSVCIWNITYNNNTFKCENINTLKYSHSICSLVWKNSKQLYISTVNCDIYKYEMNMNNECKEEENVKLNDKVVKDNDSDDEDFDIDMGGDDDEEPIKKVLRSRTFEEDSESDNENKLMEKAPENISATGNGKDTLQAELVAAAEMFGDEMAEEVSDKGNMEEDVSMKDSGEDLKDFIIDDENNKNEMDNESENINNIEIREEVYRQSDNDAMDVIHKAFVNGGTEFDEDGQRYLLMNKIGAVIVRKRSQENEVSNDIMNAFATGKYCIDIDFFDQSKYSRSMTFKTDYNFICCDMNSNGIIFGSTPGDDIRESIIKYKPILRHNIYSNFSSEKDCEWTYMLPENEICVSVGLTNKYVIVASDKRYLRMLSIGGLQVNNVISLPKDVINIGCNKENNRNIIAVTFSDYSLWVLDLDNNKKLYDGYCAVSDNKSMIVRVFMIENKLITIDSNNIVRLWCDNNIFNEWIVLLDINMYLNQKYPMDGNNNNNISNIRPKGVWPVYFDIYEKCLMVMELKFIDYPIPSETNNSYILTDYKLFLPLLNMNDNMNENNNKLFGDNEEEIMNKSLIYNQLSDSNENKSNKKQLLKEYITLFNNACKNNKQILAYDIAMHFLNTEKALSNAIKIAMHNQLPLLAEQLSNLTKKTMEKNNKNNINNQNNRVKKPSRGLGKLKRPTAKLNNKNKQILKNNINNINNGNGNEKTQVIGKKRPNNPCSNNGSIQPPSKKGRNPFSCNGNGKNDNRKNNNSIFTV